MPSHEGCRLPLNNRAPPGILVGPSSTAMTCPLRSNSITESSSLLRGSPPLICGDFCQVILQGLFSLTSGLCVRDWSARLEQGAPVSPYIRSGICRSPKAACSQGAPGGAAHSLRRTACAAQGRSDTPDPVHSPAPNGPRCPLFLLVRDRLVDHRALRHQAEGQETPERHHQLAG